MVIFYIKDKYLISFKQNNKISIYLTYPKYEQIYMQIIFDNHINFIKRRESTDWWAFTAQGLVKASNFLLSYDERGFSVPNNDFNHGILYINYGQKNRDLESVIYSIGKKYI